jgi:hypothetical protein
MNKGTFGDTPAAIILAQILTEKNDKKITRCVSNLLNGYGRANNAIRDAKGILVTPKVKNYLYTLVYNDSVSRANNSLDNEVLTFVLNLLHKEYALTLKDYKTKYLEMRRMISKNAIIQSQKQLEINKQNKI